MRTKHFNEALLRRKHRISVQKRMAWRDLKGNASPVHWMSDEEVEHHTPRMVSVVEIQEAVRLANAAPDLLAALMGLINVATHPQCTKTQIRTIANEARAVIAKAEGRI